MAEANRTVSEAKAQAKKGGEDVVKAAEEHVAQIVEGAKAEADKLEVTRKPPASSNYLTLT